MRSTPASESVASRTFQHCGRWMCHSLRGRVLLPDVVLTTLPDSPWKWPSEFAHSHRGREPAEGEQRSGTTQFANQMLTRMHGRIRMTGHGYGRELANAQYTRTFSDRDGHPRTLVCGFRSRSLRGWGFESLRPHERTQQAPLGQRKERRSAGSSAHSRQLESGGGAAAATRTAVALG
jgi:hypothetical protein